MNQKYMMQMTGRDVPSKYPTLISVHNDTVAIFKMTPFTGSISICIRLPIANLVILCPGV